MSSRWLTVTSIYITKNKSERLRLIVADSIKVVQLAFITVNLGSLNCFCGIIKPRLLLWAE